MTWYCIIIDDGEPRAPGAVAFVRSLRLAWRSAGQPAQATAFINRGAASRFTFLLSPEAAGLVTDQLRRHGASACPRAPNLSRYAPLPL